MRKPLINALLQNDMIGAGFKIDDLGGLGIGYKTVKEVCLGIRTSAKPGSGTWDDPFDASTAVKHDTIWREQIAPFSNTIVRYRDGLFLTTGSSYQNALGYLLPVGCKIYGAGMNDTIVQCTLYPAAAGVQGKSVFATAATVDNAGAEVNDLTVDCNWQNLGAAVATKMGGIFLAGNNCKIRRVRCINGYGNLASLAEAFTMMIVSHYLAGTVFQSCVGALIEECLAESFQGNYGVAMAMFAGNGNGTGNLSGKLLSNTVRSWQATCAYQAMGTGIDFLHNLGVNCTQGIYVDTGKFDDVLIHGNRFMGTLLRGIVVDLSLADDRSCKNLVIEGNVLETTRSMVDSVNSITVSASTTGIVSNARISRNTITHVGTPFITGGTGLVVQRTEGILIDGNLINGVAANVLTTAVTDLTVRHNFTATGAAPPELEDSFPAPGAMNYDQFTGDANATWEDGKKFLRQLATTAVRTITLPNVLAYDDGEIITFINRSSTASGNGAQFQAATGQSIDGNTAGVGYTTPIFKGNKITIRFEALSNGGPGGIPAWIKLPETNAHFPAPSASADTFGIPFDTATDESYLYVRTPVGAWKRVAIASF